MMRKIFVTALLGAVVLASCTTNHPTDVTGDWSYSKDLVSFDAVVEDQAIEIYLTTDGTTGLYWTGDFVNELDDGVSFTSRGDMDRLNVSLFGSLDQSKEFTYQDGTIVFEFGIMGTTTDIQLERE